MPAATVHLSGYEFMPVGESVSESYHTENPASVNSSEAILKVCSKLEATIS